MLRNFAYSPKTSQLIEILERFGFESSKEKFPFTLLCFEIITPDSFMWRLLIGNNIYYLYAEDYVPGLEHVKNVLSSYLEDSKWGFIEPARTVMFENATSVAGATVYKKPDDANAMMKYAVDSGHDFVFLVKSQRDAGEAQFSDHAPGGFTQK